MKILCCYDEAGRISNLIFEPIPAGFSNHYKKLGILHSLFENPDNLDAVEVATLYHVVDGAVVPRPDNPAKVAQDGRALHFSDVPAGSVVTAVLDAGTPFERRETIEDDAVEFDEAGKLRITIAAPWPYLEGIYDVEVK